MPYQYGPWITPNPVTTVRAGLGGGDGFGVTVRSPKRSLRGWTDESTLLTNTVGWAYSDDRLDWVQGFLQYANTPSSAFLTQLWLPVHVYLGHLTYSPVLPAGADHVQLWGPGGSVDSWDPISPFGFDAVSAVSLAWAMREDTSIAPGQPVAAGGDTIGVYLEPAGYARMLDPGSGFDIVDMAAGMPDVDQTSTGTVYPDGTNKIAGFMTRDGLLSLTELDSQLTAANNSFDITIPTSAFADQHIGFGAFVASMRLAVGRQVSLDPPMTAGTSWVNDGGGSGATYSLSVTWTPPAYRFAYPTTAIDVELPSIAEARAKAHLQSQLHVRGG